MTTNRDRHPPSRCHVPRELVLGPAELAESFPARGVPDTCIRCHQPSLSWTFLCSSYANELRAD
jgi:hypothetical protein